MNDRLAARRFRARTVAVVSGLVLVGIAGYLGFVAFVETGNRGGLGAGVMGLAVATGFVAFFSPCSFPLLLTFLGRQTTSGSFRRVLASALLVGAGAAVFFVLFGLTIAVVGEGVSVVVGFDTLTGRLFRALIGLLLLFLGLRQAALMRVRVPVFDTIGSSAANRFNPSSYQSRLGRDFVYGFGYPIAGFG